VLGLHWALEVLQSSAALAFVLMDFQGRDHSNHQAP
jgi:hypothetical protein